MTDYVNFDKAKTERLRKAHKEAEQAGLESFTFEGKQYHTKYAYYLLQYLDDRMKQ